MVTSQSLSLLVLLWESKCLLRHYSAETCMHIIIMFFLNSSYETECIWKLFLSIYTKNKWGKSPYPPAPSGSCSSSQIVQTMSVLWLKWSSAQVIWMYRSSFGISFPHLQTQSTTDNQCMQIGIRENLRMWKPNMTKKCVFNESMHLLESFVSDFTHQWCHNL